MMVVAFLSAATCFSIGPVSLSVWSTISPVTPNDSRPFNKKRSTNLSCPFFWTAVATVDPELVVYHREERDPGILVSSIVQERVVHLHDWCTIVTVFPSAEVTQDLYGM